MGSQHPLSCTTAASPTPSPPALAQVESLVDQLAAAKRDAALGGEGGGGDGIELAMFRSRTAISRQSFRGKTQFAQVAAHSGDDALSGVGARRSSSGSFSRQASGSISSGVGIVRPRGDGSGAGPATPQGRLNRAGSVRGRGDSRATPPSAGAAAARAPDNPSAAFVHVNPLADQSP